jgi:hypothetical protein
MKIEFYTPKEKAPPKSSDLTLVLIKNRNTERIIDFDFVILFYDKNEWHNFFNNEKFEHIDDLLYWTYLKNFDDLIPNLDRQVLAQTLSLRIKDPEFLKE